MSYRVAKTKDGRILVEEAPAFAASFVNGAWRFVCVFTNAAELTDVKDPEEAERLYQEAKAAASNRAAPISDPIRTNSAKEFYRSMYSGADPDPDQYGIAGGADDDPPSDDSDTPPDDSGTPPSPSRVPRRPPPFAGEGAMEAALDNERNEQVAE